MKLRVGKRRVDGSTGTHPCVQKRGEQKKGEGGGQKPKG